jgi:hypothetical protein
VRGLGTGSLLMAIEGTSIITDGISSKLPVRGRFLGDSGVSLARRCCCDGGSLGLDFTGGGGGGGRGGGGAPFCG